MLWIQEPPSDKFKVILQIKCFSPSRLMGVLPEARVCFERIVWVLQGGRGHREQKMDENWITPKIEAPKIPGKVFEWQLVTEWQETEYTLWAFLMSLGKDYSQEFPSQQSTEQRYHAPSLPRLFLESRTGRLPQERQWLRRRLLQCASVHRAAPPTLSSGNFWLHHGEEGEPYSVFQFGYTDVLSGF